jgi:hypothetical protein
VEGTSLTVLVGHNSPTFHFHQDDGVFDRFTMHVNTLWDETQRVG